MKIDSFDLKDESGGLKSDSAQNFGNENLKEMENKNHKTMGNMEFNEAGNVMLCCFAAFLIQLYYFDI